MAVSKDDLNKFKKEAAEKAVEMVEDGMVLGLGTGSTVRFALEKLGELIRTEKLDIVGIPTSLDTDALARKLEIPLTDLETHPKIDLTIDGADEVDPGFTLIKGLGGALLREKIVAKNSEKEIIIVDYTKMVQKLGTKSPLPVEVLPFGWTKAVEFLQGLDCVVTPRKNQNGIVVSDNNNYFLDCKFQAIEDPVSLEAKINNFPGVIENGLFIGLTTTVIIASPNGTEVLFR
jgi:ribose 5-phosphate isomerase A